MKGELIYRLRCIDKDTMMGHLIHEYMAEERTLQDLYSHCVIPIKEQIDVAPSTMKRILGHHFEWFKNFELPQ